MLATVINRILSRLRKLDSSQKTHLPPDYLLQRTYKIKKTEKTTNAKGQD